MAYPSNSYSYDTMIPRTVPYEEEERVRQIVQEWQEMARVRAPFDIQFEQVASLILPTHRGSFSLNGFVTPGTKQTDQQIDATGMSALGRFSAICDSLLTPRNQFWHGLKASDPNVMKDRRTALWFENANRKVFDMRYAATANFASQNQSIFKSLGAFGTGGLFIDKFYTHTGIKSLRYTAVPLGELYLHENQQGLVDGFVRAFRFTARQAEQKWPGKLPPIMQAALKNNSEQFFMFLHHVCPRTDDYDPEALDARSLYFRSCYVSVDAKCMMQAESGYNTFPLAPARYEQAPNSIYGTSPAMMVLPALKTLNTEKKIFLKVGHRAGDPVLLTYDDGLMNLSLKPGAINPGGMSSEGRPLVGTIPAGSVQITKEMMDGEVLIINDAFLVTLFQILTETGTMTATEVIERTNEKGILLAPTVGRQDSEYKGPMVDRELDLLMQMGELEPMPPALKEAKGHYTIVHTSPLARAARAQEAAGWMRTIESVKELVAISGRQDLLDPFSFERAIPAIAEIQMVPPSWMASPDEISQKKQQRAQAQATQQRVEAAPAAAALMNANTKAQQAGVPQQAAQPQPGA